jgi:hypothetical protein
MENNYSKEDDGNLVYEIINPSFYKTKEFLLNKMKELDPYLYIVLKDIKFKRRGNLINLDIESKFKKKIMLELNKRSYFDKNLLNSEEDKNGVNLDLSIDLKIKNSVDLQKLEQLDTSSFDTTSFYDSTNNIVYLDDKLIVDLDLEEIHNIFMRIYLAYLLKISSNRSINDWEVYHLPNPDNYTSEYWFLKDIINYFNTPNAFVSKKNNVPVRKLFRYFKAKNYLPYFEKIFNFEDFFYNNIENFYEQVYKEENLSLNLPEKLSLDKKIKEVTEMLGYTFYSNLSSVYNKTLNPIKKLRIITLKDVFETLMNMPLEELEKYNLEEKIGYDFSDITKKLFKIYKPKHKKMTLLDYLKSSLAHLNPPEFL